MLMKFMTTAAASRVLLANYLFMIYC